MTSRNRRTTVLYALLLLLSLVTVSCKRNVVYTKYHTFDNNEWASKDKAEFEVEIKDTESLNNIFLLVRHADAYPYNNLYLFVTSAYPDGKVMTDTMEVVLANSKGEWVGSGAGDIFDLKIPVKKNVRFPLAGKYKFTFEQAMRTDPLPMIMDIGFQVEKSE